MITSKENAKLKLIRRLRDRRTREREGLFVAEGEDLVAAAAKAGAEPVFVLRSGIDVEPGLLDAVSELGSGTRVLGVYRRRWADADREAGLRIYLDGVADPGNVGAVIRTVDALAGGRVAIGPATADPYSPKAVRASMGSVFSVELERGDPGTLAPPVVGLAAHGGAPPDDEPVATLALGGERGGLTPQVAARCDRTWTIPLRPGGPDSLNVAAAAAIALWHISSAAAEHHLRA